MDSRSEWCEDSYDCDYPSDGMTCMIDPCVTDPDDEECQPLHTPIFEAFKFLWYHVCKPFI